MHITSLEIIRVIADVFKIISVIVTIAKPVHHCIKEVASRLLRQMTRLFSGR